MKIVRLRSLFFVLLIIVFGQVLLFAQTAENDLAKNIQENYTKCEVLIPMRDGVKLFTSIYEPKDKAQKYPMVPGKPPFAKIKLYF